jgi:AcrR family transcriptional regulator
MSKDKRKQSILSAAMTEAKHHGYTNVTREAIAQRATCAPALVSFYFGTMVDLKRAIMSEAIRTRELRIVAQGIADGHPKAKRAPEELRLEALQYLMGV